MNDKVEEEKDKKKEYKIVFYSSLVLFNIFICYVFKAYRDRQNFIRYKKRSDLNLGVGTYDTDLQNNFQKEIEFLQFCVDDSIKSSDHPKVSLIIPFFNDGVYLKRCLRSIQNQIIKEIEIIIIDDSSTDRYSTELLRQYSQIDNRIKVIRNKKNIGKLYSYVLGILEASGEYIMLVSPTDMLLSNLEVLYEESKINNKDINDFSYIQGPLYNFEQIKLEDKEENGENIIQMIFSYKYGESHITNKLYNAQFLKSAVKYLEKEYLKLNSENHVESFLYICFFSAAKSYKSYSNLFSHFLIHNNQVFKEIEIGIHNDLFISSMCLLKYLNELNYSSSNIFNGFIELGLKQLRIAFNKYPYSKFRFDTDKIKSIKNDIIKNADLNEENKKEMQDLFGKLLKEEI